MAVCLVTIRISAHLPTFFFLDRDGDERINKIYKLLGGVILLMKFD